MHNTQGQGEGLWLELVFNVIILITLLGLEVGWRSDAISNLLAYCQIADLTLSLTYIYIYICTLSGINHGVPICIIIRAKFLIANDKNTVHRSPSVITERLSWVVFACSVAKPHEPLSTGRQSACESYCGRTRTARAQIAQACNSIAYNDCTKRINNSAN